MTEKSGGEIDGYKNSAWPCKMELRRTIDENCGGFGTYSFKYQRYINAYCQTTKDSEWKEFNEDLPNNSACLVGKIHEMALN